MSLFCFFSKEKLIENVQKLFEYGIFEVFLQSFSLFILEFPILRKALDGILNIFKTLKIGTFMIERANLLNKISEFNCEWFFDEIIQQNNLSETLDLIGAIRTKFQRFCSN